MSWLQVEISVPAADVDTVDAALQDLGALSVTLTDPGGTPILEPAPGSTPLWPEVVVGALLPAGIEEPAVRARLREALPAHSPTIRFSLLEERDWVREFRENLAPLRFGAHLWICPAGTACPDPEGVAVVLEPGLAFGSGSHPTTAMCLDWLAGLPLRGAAVLDWGCGSGILAIAALALGARSVTALDIDPQALQATRDNARQNGVEQALQVRHPDELPPEERYDVVVANILAGSLIELAPRLARHCRTGAHMALSGILDAQARAVRESCAPWLELRLAAEAGGWVLLTGTAR